MNVDLLAFASAADAIGRDRRQLDLPDSVRDIGALKEYLGQQHPGLLGLWQRLAVAIDGEVVGDRAPLRDGCEVALLPPVSGGTTSEAPCTAERVGVDDRHLTTAALDGTELQRQVEDDRCGAVLVFSGNVRSTHRSETGECLTVTAIDYSAYRSMALERLQRIEEELSESWTERSGQPVRVRLRHRLGEVPAGETSVLIAVAAAHRDACYQASREALERLKKEVPIWKREHFADGTSTWREVEPLS